MMVPYVLVLYLLSTVRADQAREGHAGALGAPGTGVPEKPAATPAGSPAARQLSVLADFDLAGDPTLAANVPSLRSRGSTTPSLAVSILTPTPTQEANDALRWIIKLGHTSTTQITTQTTEAKRTEQTTPAAAAAEPTTATTAAASTTTRAPSTTAAVSATARPWLRPSLYCFVVLMAETYELELVKSQYSREVGIFRCNLYDVLSDNEASLAPGVETTPVGSLKAPKCWWGSWCNAEAFLKAWTEVIKMERFKKAAWTVKADPDTVFFPSRLRQHVRDVQGDGGMGLYFKNWNQQFGLLGPIEVFSRQAIVTFGAGQESCVQQSDPRQSGEDGFMQSCMEFLHVEHKDDFSLLDGSGSLDSCGSSKWTVSFHAFKTESGYMDCVTRADGVSPTTRAPPAPTSSPQPAPTSTAGRAPAPAGTTQEAAAPPPAPRPPATTPEAPRTTSKSADSADDDAGGSDEGTCCTSSSDANDKCNTCYQNALLGSDQYCSKSKSNCMSCNGAWCGPGFKHARMGQFIAKSSYHESLRRADQPAAAQSSLHLGAGVAAASMALLAAAPLVVRRVRSSWSGSYAPLAPAAATPS